MAIMVASCATPEKDGKKAAENENYSAEKCIEAVQKLESDFVSNFNPNDYTCRSQATNAYQETLKLIGDAYYSDRDAAAIRTSELKGKYSDSYKNLSIFEMAYRKVKNNEIQLTASLLIGSDVFPPAVIACINRIIPPKPNLTQIKTDLVGHSISEGFDRKDCYFSKEWKRTFGENIEIIDFHIDEITQDNGREYSFLTSMVLKEEHLSYNARVQIYYILPYGEDWKIDFVKSLGVKIIPTHKYDDCIQCVIDEDGWGGSNALFITNISEVQLIVIGKVRTKYNNEIHLFNQIIPSGEKKQVGGLFSVGSVYDYEIVYVERL